MRFMISTRIPRNHHFDIDVLESSFLKATYRNSFYGCIAGCLLSFIFCYVPISLVIEHYDMLVLNFSKQNFKSLDLLWLCGGPFVFFASLYFFIISLLDLGRRAFFEISDNKFTLVHKLYWNIRTTKHDLKDLKMASWLQKRNRQETKLIVALDVDFDEIILKEFKNEKPFVDFVAKLGTCFNFDDIETERSIRYGDPKGFTKF